MNRLRVADIIIPSLTAALAVLGNVEIQPDRRKGPEKSKRPWLIVVVSYKQLKES